MYFQIILGYNNRASYVPWFNYGGIFLGKMFDFQMANYNFFQFLPKMQIFPKTLRDTFLEALEVTFTVSHSVIQSFGHSVIWSFSHSVIQSFGATLVLD